MTPAPGIYPHIPFHQYQNWKAIGPSSAKAAEQSLLNYKATIDGIKVKSQTRAMSLGSAGHCVFWEADEFILRYAIWNGGIKRGGKWDEFCDANSDKEIISLSDYKACLNIRDAIRNQPAARKLFVPGALSEVSLRWDECGTACKGRPDYVARDIVDLKLTARMDVRTMESVAARLGYHISLAAYQEGLAILTGDRKAVKIIFAEMTPPHDVVVMHVPDDVLLKGLDKWHELIIKIGCGEESKTWPGISDTELTLNLPAWYGLDDQDQPITIGGEEL